jgi:hypothetical protein
MHEQWEWFWQTQLMWLAFWVVWAAITWLIITGPEKSGIRDVPPLRPPTAENNPRVLGSGRSREGEDL